MWIEIDNTWYNLSNSYRINLHDNQVTIYFIGDTSPTLLMNVSEENTVLIKNFLNGRDN